MVNHAESSARARVTQQCPCCGETSACDQIAAISYEAIWSSLAEVWGGEFSTDVLASNTPQKDAIFVECPTCHLQFFWPLSPGDVGFYEQLGRSNRYYPASPWKWEFGWLAESLSSRDKVLDVGCGIGEFLASIRKDVSAAVGLELSSVAADQARSRGVTVFEQTIQSYAEAHPHEFDVACSFHVLEHLSDPSGFLRAMAGAVKPGGRVVLSVPNRERSRASGFEALDCPPHHISRWSASQLRRIGERCGLEVAETVIEPPSPEIVQAVVRERLLGVAANRISRGGRVASSLAWRVSRLLGPQRLGRFSKAPDLYEKSGFQGFALLASYRVPR